MSDCVVPGGHLWSQPVNGLCECLWCRKRITVPEVTWTDGTKGHEPRGQYGLLPPLGFYDDSEG